MLRLTLREWDTTCCCLSTDCECFRSQCSGHVAQDCSVSGLSSTCQVTDTVEYWITQYRIQSGRIHKCTCEVEADDDCDDDFNKVCIECEPDDYSGIIRLHFFVLIINNKNRVDYHFWRGVPFKHFKPKSRRMICTRRTLSDVLNDVFVPSWFGSLIAVRFLSCCERFAT